MFSFNSWEIHVVWVYFYTYVILLIFLQYTNFYVFFKVYFYDPLRMSYQFLYFHCFQSFFSHIYLCIFVGFVNFQQRIYIYNCFSLKICYKYWRLIILMFIDSAEKSLSLDHSEGRGCWTRWTNCIRLSFVKVLISLFPEGSTLAILTNDSVIRQKKKYVCLRSADRP